jgi:Ca2+-binding EF-hand superfamily protein
LKIEVSLKADFNVIDAFRILDLKNLGCITHTDFVLGLKQNLGFYDFSNDDIYLFFRRVDHQNLGHVTFDQYGDLILPFSEEYA